MPDSEDKVVSVETAQGKLLGRPKEIFFTAYEQQPPWEIDRPQAFVRELFEQGVFQGRILDVGCGTGENAILLTQHGLHVDAFDMVPKAIEAAKTKSSKHGLKINFFVQDVLKLPPPEISYDVVLDSGVFHVFSDENRKVYEARIHEQLKPGGTLIIVCFSEHQPGTDGPRRVTQQELHTVFDPRWECLSIRPTIYETTVHDGGGAKAWLSLWKK